MKKIILLGASGSIGKQTLKLIKQYPNEFCLVGISVNTNVSFLNDVLDEFDSIKYCCITDSNVAKKCNISNLFVGNNGLGEMLEVCEADMVVNAISGIAGLYPTLVAIENDLDIAMANKEAIVCGGELIKKALAKHPVKFYPVDSEHSAIYQCLQGENHDEIYQLILTASGGPFRDYSLKDLENVTIDDTLNHPNWKMGKKITVDSATLVNKGLEIIEASYLFNVDCSKIKAVIHRESIVHSLVEFNDGSIKAQLGVPSMELPILYALSDNKRLQNDDNRLNLSSILSLNFSPIDTNKFPAIELAYEALKLKGSALVAYSVANEVAVEAFLNKKIKYLDIVKVINKVLKEHKLVKEYDYNKLCEIVEEIKVLARSICQKMKEE